MRASIHYVNGQEAALIKLGYYDRDYDPYAYGHAMRDQQRLEMEDKDHRARAFAGKAMRNPGELEALQQKLTQNEIDESRAAHGVAGGFLGGSLGALGGSALGAAIRPHGPASALGMLGGAALGGYGGYRLMEPMGQEAGQASADEILDLAHTHGLQNLPRPSASAAPSESTAKSAMWDISPEQLKMMGRHTAAGTLGGAVGGGLMADDGERVNGMLRGSLMGGSSVGAGTLLGNLAMNAVGPHILHDIDPVILKKTRKEVEQRMLDQSGPASAGFGMLGAGAGATGVMDANKKDQPKLAFMGLDPNAMRHVGLRAAGGAAAGAGIGAVAGGEDNRMSGALAGGALGGLGAGGASLANKGLMQAGTKQLDRAIQFTPGHMPFNGSEETNMRLIQHLRNNPSRVAAGITGSGMGRTMAGGAAMGAVPAMAAGRMTRDE